MEERTIFLLNELLSALDDIPIYEWETKEKFERYFAAMDEARSFLRSCSDGE